MFRPFTWWRSRFEYSEDCSLQPILDRYGRVLSPCSWKPLGCNFSVNNVPCGMLRDLASFAFFLPVLVRCRNKDVPVLPSSPSHRPRRRSPWRWTIAARHKPSGTPGCGRRSGSGCAQICRRASLRSRSRVASYMVRSLRTEPHTRPVVEPQPPAGFCFVEPLVLCDARYAPRNPCRPASRPASAAPDPAVAIATVLAGTLNDRLRERIFIFAPYGGDSVACRAAGWPAGTPVVTVFSASRLSSGVWAKG